MLPIIYRKLLTTMHRNSMMHCMMMLNIPIMESERSCKLIRHVHHLQLRSSTDSSPRYEAIYESKRIADNLQCRLLANVRHYSKSKDKKKEKKGGRKIEINEQQLSEIFNYQGFKGQMENTISQMHDDFVKQLSVRSTSSAIDKLRVHVDGKEHELQQLAQISRKNPKTVVVNMIGFPQLIPDVLVAIEKSGMNLNPQQDGTTLFIPIPKVTKEHRENLAKNAKGLYLKCRDALKDLQNQTIKKVKNKKISEDEMYAVQGQITAVTDKYVNEANKILEAKQKELLDSA